MCSNIGIMINGELKCLGSLHHLKSRYGRGFTLLVKLATTTTQPGAAAANSQRSQNVMAFVEFIFRAFKGSIQLREKRESYVNIHIDESDSAHTLSTLFALVESVKAQFAIEYYMVTQTKLEEIFLHLASSQLVDSDNRKMRRRKLIKWRQR